MLEEFFLELLSEQLDGPQRSYAAKAQARAFGFEKGRRGGGDGDEGGAERWRAVRLCLGVLCDLAARREARREAIVGGGSGALCSLILRSPEINVGDGTEGEQGAGGEGSNRRRTSSCSATMEPLMAAPVAGKATASSAGGFRYSSALTCPRVIKRQCA